MEIDMNTHAFPRGFGSYREVHTQPGACLDDPFCPPPGWDGGRQEYVALMQERWNDMDWGQCLRLNVAIAMNNAVTADGPFADVAADLLSQLLTQRGGIADIKVIKH